jgi:hypothetical protein
MFVCWAICCAVVVIVDVFQCNALLKWSCLWFSVPEIIATFGNPYTLLYRNLEKEIEAFDSDPYWTTGGNSFVVSCTCGKPQIV